ncbi:hypothetical protein ABZ153_14345 [Streptomyces sp. NPDC006290]|uniref:hypothetical protein n=1 Tax=Streptomyces sp. NPDC006290 TaxID=3156745 RepID=UPI0033B50690
MLVYAGGAVLMAALKDSVAKARKSRGEDATVHDLSKKKTAAKKTTTTKTAQKKQPAKKAAKKTTARKPRRSA